MDDRSVIAAQIGRKPRAFESVACRCPLGFPAITEQRPYDEGGKPFPTGYYLTCPHIVSAVARLEAAGGVERWSEAVRSSYRLRWSLMRANKKQRRLRKKLARSTDKTIDRGASLKLGIAGSRRGQNLKCLHAHVAFALANPGYTLGERITAEIDSLWPADCEARERCRSGSKPRS
ncbi:MAG: DUF501 domain-containing protein [Gaiellaceae bacterium]